MMVYVLNELLSGLANISCLQRGFDMMTMHAPPVTWVDDVAIPIVAPSADMLEDTIIQVAETSVTAFQKFGLSLNFKHKKTEVVVTFRNAGAPAKRKSLMVDRLGLLHLPTLQSSLKCVATYEHLGTIFSADGDTKSEISHRKARATQAYRQVSKPILRNRFVPIETCLKLFESLIVPVILHRAGNWALLPHRQFQSLHSCIMKWQRSKINH